MCVCYNGCWRRCRRRRWWWWCAASYFSMKIYTEERARLLQSWRAHHRHYHPLFVRTSGKWSAHIHKHSRSFTVQTPACWSTRRRAVDLRLSLSLSSVLVSSNSIQLLLIAFFSLDYTGQTYTRTLTQDSFMLKTHPASSNRSHIALLQIGEAVLAFFSVYLLAAPNSIFDGLVFDENGRNKNLHVTSSSTFLLSVSFSITQKNSI